MEAGARTAPRARARRLPSGGFTLIELLAVLVILSILAAVLLTNLGGSRELMEEKATRSAMIRVQAALTEYSQDEGGFPPSALSSELGGAPNDTNLGAESLYLALCREGAPGMGTLEGMLANTDADSLGKRPAGFEKADLLELADAWENPLAYFHNLDYEREQRYVTVGPDSGEPIESVARARRNQQTGRWHEPRGYQLLSAGLDGQFGTEDDIASFER